MDTGIDAISDRRCSPHVAFSDPIADSQASAMRQIDRHLVNSKSRAESRTGAVWAHYGHTNENAEIPL